MRRCALALLAATLVAPPVAAQSTAAVSIADAVPDVGSGTITIAGGGLAGRPLVTLDLIPLDIQLAIDTRIVAAAPLASMPAGKYLLTVSRGSAPGETASFQLTLGAVPPDRSTDLALRGPAPGLAATDPAATVGDRTISVGDVDREWQRTDSAGYLTLMRELDEHRRRVANTMVADELLSREAAARGTTVEALLAEEIPKRTIAMPDAAVTSLYLSLGDRTRGASIDQMRPALRAWLQRNTEPELAKMSFVEELMKTSARADVLLDAPRVEVAVSADDPALGPVTAPVVLLAFGDLQSAEYVKFVQPLARVRETFGDRVRIVYQALPTFGDTSTAVAEAAACAQAQGKFWAYHDAAAKPGTLDAARLKALAGEAGLDRRRIRFCVDGRTFRELISGAVERAAHYGISASPAFMVNGRLAPPPPPFLPPFEFLSASSKTSCSARRGRRGRRRRGADFRARGSRRSIPGDPPPDC